MHDLGILVVYSVPRWAIVKTAMFDDWVDELELDVSLFGKSDLVKGVDPSPSAVYRVACNQLRIKYPMPWLDPPEARAKAHATCFLKITSSGEGQLIHHLMRETRIHVPTVGSRRHRGAYTVDRVGHVVLIPARGPAATRPLPTVTGMVRSPDRDGTVIIHKLEKPILEDGLAKHQQNYLSLLGKTYSDRLRRFFQWSLARNCEGILICEGGGAYVVPHKYGDTVRRLGLLADRLPMDWCETVCPDNPHNRKMLAAPPRHHW